MSSSSHLAAGYQWLFDEQVIQYSAQGRNHCYEVGYSEFCDVFQPSHLCVFQLVAEAIRRAVSSCRSPTRSSKISKAEATESTRDATTDNAPVIHAAGGAAEEFKAVLL